MRRIARRPSRAPGAVVLVYHRVATIEHDPQCLAVSPERFAEHLDVMAAHGRPMPLDDLARRAGETPRAPGAVAVTVDDGYADALHEAAPRLAHAGVPATVFVTTGAIDAGREFWWDEIEGLLLQPGTLPSRPCLSIGGERVEWSLGDAARLDASAAARHAAWTVERAETPTPRHQVYRDLCVRLRLVRAHVRDDVITQLAALAGRPRLVRSTHRPLTSGEVSTLSRAPGIRIGSHTVSHPSLAALPGGDQRREIAGARGRLESLIASPVTSLAYPFGGPDDVAEATAAAAREEGVTLACTTVPGAVRADTDPLFVPRIVVRNWSRTEFLDRWSQWTAA